ncbi:DUF6438 domain-containing protein [Nitrosopumilus sp. b2]|uniref:DUF6438 domain-containing protein n=1 Tax=Nitrosopumilus sp. b2 TaxID=2109908 RepID=UPI0015F67706|nr:DUF6438 domain-containing protein [Nitrosopumilus sp. b2]KAF6245217.1 hypothetical protein C6989_04625 [Nitrosopumilus sp. b2]
MKTRFLIILGIVVAVSVLYASISINDNAINVIYDSQRNSVDIFQDFVNSQKRVDTTMNTWFDMMLHSDDDLKNTVAILESEKNIQDKLYDEYVNLSDSEKTNEEIHRKIIDSINDGWLAKNIENLKPQKDAERIFRITLEHNGCENTCPVYSIMIDGDGSVLYKGLKNVKEIGKQEYQIQSDVLTELNPFLLEAYRDNIDEYGVQDDAKNTVIITIQFGQPKRITNHDNSGPVWLKDFEDKINEIAQTRQYVFG